MSKKIFTALGNSPTDQAMFSPIVELAKVPALLINATK